MPRSHGPPPGFFRMSWLAERYRKIEHLYQRGIWQSAALQDRSLRGRVCAALRVLSITLTSLFENHITTRAAALSYASLLGLGPLLAMVVLVAGFTLDQRDPQLAVNALNRIIKFVAPQIIQYERLDDGAEEPSASGQAPAAPESAGAGKTKASRTKPDEAGTIAVNPDLVHFINGIIAGSRSGTAGFVGALTLVLIVIQLFTSVETTFNVIWGVRRGRSWLMRVVFYWTIVTLGAVIFFASLTALSASALLNLFFEKLPFGVHLFAFLQWMLPALSVVLLAAVLTVFYCCIPNTRVYWMSAAAGAVVVTVLLFLNQYLAFLYFKRVVLQKSLYGSLGMIPILMIGLYIFWFFVLVGGQISYAVQNVHFRRSQAAWQSLSAAARESLSLLVLLAIARRFKEVRPPVTASELGELIKVPTQILNECLNRLGDLNLVSALPPAAGQAELDYRYQPARPLERITLGEFKEAFENQGEDPGGATLDAIDPVLQLYHDRLGSRLRETFGTQTLSALLDEFPSSCTAPAKT